MHRARATLLVDGGFLFHLVHEPMAALGAAESVDGLVARERERPSERLATGAVVEPRLVPDLHEHILEHILGLRGIVQHLVGSGKEYAGVAFVELPEAIPVAAASGL